MSPEANSKRLLEVLDQALVLQGKKRRSFVDGIRQTDPQLYGELEALLDAEEDLSVDFLNRPVAEEHAEMILESGDDEGGADDPQTEFPGSKITADGKLVNPIRVGPYRLLELLGSGGMGRVFLAEQEQPLKRRVALKLMRSSFADVTAQVRFDAERQALARLQHPNIGRILDAGTTDDGFPYFVLELVEGPSLNDYCDEQRLTIEQRIELMIEVCRGVEHAHRHQLIHRDLKPSNILVAEIDDRPVPKIIDFGVAKSLDGPLTEATLKTGILLGTPAYMSPEALDRSIDVDTRTDVYSLGIILYELMIGQRPFKTGESSLPRLLRLIAEEAPIRPSTALATTVAEDTRSQIAIQRQSSPEELRHRLRGDLDWILLKSIAKVRSARYGSASELADDLERHLRHEPVAAGPPSVGYRLRKLIRRHRGAVAAGGIIAMLLVTGLVLEVRSRSRTDRMARTSQELTREVERIEWLQRVAYLLPEKNLTPELDQIRQGMVRIRTKMSEMDSWGEGPGHYALGRGALGLGELAEARRHLELAWNAGYQRPEVALALGTALGALYEGQLESVERLPDPETRRRLRADAERQLRDPALAMLARVGELAQSAPELLAARIALHQRELETAIEQSRAAIAEHPGLYEARFLEAQALQRQAAEAQSRNDLDDADELLAAAADAVKAGIAVGRSDPEGYLRLCRIHVRRLNLAVRYVRPGTLDFHADAVDACRRARGIHPALGGVDLEEASAWLSLADTQVWDLAEDPTTALEQLATRLESYLDAHPDAGEAHLLLGRGEILRSTYLDRAGRDPRPAMDVAVEHLERALELEPGYDFININLSGVLARRGYYNANRGGDPRPDYQRAVEFSRAAVTANPDELGGYTHLAQALTFLAEYQVDHGIDPLADLDEATVALTRAAEIDPQRASVPSTQTGVELIRSFWVQKTGGDTTHALDAMAVAADRFLALNPGAAFGLLMRGQVQLHNALRAASQGEDPTPYAQEARQWYSRGMEKIPRLPGPYVELAELSLGEATYQLAIGQSPQERALRTIELADRALEIDTERADAHRARGEAQLILAVWRSHRGSGSPRNFETAFDSLQTAAAQEPTDATNPLAIARLIWQHLEARGDAAALPGLEGPLAPHGIAYAEEALRLDPSLNEARVVRGALLARATETRSEGLREVSAALTSNRNLAFEWQPWLEKVSESR